MIASRFYPRDYQLHLPQWLGLALILAGVAYHLLFVRCPYCGVSLAGYCPLPACCPKCKKEMERNTGKEAEDGSTGSL